MSSNVSTSTGQMAPRPTTAQTRLSRGPDDRGSALNNITPACVPGAVSECGSGAGCVDLVVVIVVLSVTGRLAFMDRTMTAVHGGPVMSNVRDRTVKRRCAGALRGLDADSCAEAAEFGGA